MILNYLKRLDKAAWGDIIQIREDQNWAEAELQVKIIYRRLSEIDESVSPASKRERAFLKYYAGLLLHIYSEGYEQVPGLPEGLIHILCSEKPGHKAVMQLALEEQKPEGKSVAITVVKAWPDISQKNLAAIAVTTQRTIREHWLDDLLAAGWIGPQQKSSNADKTEKSVKHISPERGTPSLAPVKWMEGKDPEDH